MAAKAEPAKIIVKTRLDSGEHDAFRRHAAAEGRSIASQVAYLIRQYLDGKGNE